MCLFFEKVGLSLRDSKLVQLSINWIFKKKVGLLLRDSKLSLSKKCINDAILFKYIYFFKQ